ncbi:MAG TPA: hypothetical protein VF508_12710, partial [Pyrinomonadaceae bacterium]
IAEFKRASDDFKRTWEYEVELEHRKPALDTAAVGAEPEPPADDAAAVGTTVARGASESDEPAGVDAAANSDEATWGQTAGVADAPARRDEEEDGKAS